MSPKKKTTNAALLAAIESSASAVKVVSDTVRNELAQHTRHDDERFDENRRVLSANQTTLAEIHADVKSLLASRSFTRGVLKAASVAGGTVGGIVMILSLIVQWWHGH